MTGSRPSRPSPSGLHARPPRWRISGCRGGSGNNPVQVRLWHWGGHSTAGRPAPSTLASRGSRVSLTRTDLPEPGSCDAASVPRLPSLERGSSFTFPHGRPLSHTLLAGPPPGRASSSSLLIMGAPARRALVLPLGSGARARRGRDGGKGSASCARLALLGLVWARLASTTSSPEWARQCPLPDRRLGSRGNWGEHGQALGLYRPRSEP